MYEYGIRINEDAEVVKDCIQDVFFKLIEAGKRTGSTDNIRFYLLKALKNTILKHLRHEKKILPNSDLVFKASFLLEEEILNKENVTNREKALVEALSQLSSRQREIVYLRYECEMDYDQISDIMKLKKDSARKLVFRAIKTLRVAIEGKVDTPLILFIRFQKYVF
jgi:RNA polymerase sigma factor (sigma-70 family)